MLKKMLIALCAVALAVCSVVGVSAYELDNPYMDGYSAIAYDNPSNYTVVIPDEYVASN